MLFRSVPPISNFRSTSYRPAEVSRATRLTPGCCMSGISAAKQTLAPVIDVDGEILADFDTDQLEEFWKKLEKSAA